MATNFDKDWTPFAMDAEAEAFGTARICKAHNQLRKRTEELEKWLQQQEDYTEMLMRWMSRKSLSKEDTASVYKISSWQDFCREYPADAAELEKWLAERHGD